MMLIPQSKESKNLISTLELRRLLIELKDKRPDVGVRFRTLGEMWTPYFMRILYNTEKGIVLAEVPSNKIISIVDLSMVMQFELDTRFQNYEPYFHYEAKPLGEFHHG
jgi:hypothetical protein